MRSREYWFARAARLEWVLQADAAETVDKINRLYQKSINNIQNDIDKLRRELSRLTDLPDSKLDDVIDKSGRVKANAQRLRKLYDDAEDGSEAKRTLKTIINAQAYGKRISIAESIKTQVFCEMAKTTLQGQALLTGLVENTMLKAYYTTINDIAEGFNAGIRFDLLPKAAIKRAMTENWAGGNYSSRIWRNGTRFSNAVSETIVGGLTRGLSKPQMIEKLKQYTKKNASACENLIRTEMSHFRGLGQLDAYNQAGIEEYKYMCAFDERTCDVCGALDGAVFLVSEASEGKNYHPMHPRCRCTSTINMDYKSRTARNPKTGKNERIDGSVTYKEWRSDMTAEQKAAFDKKCNNQKQLGR